jgi:3-oxoacyl-[acyl-carrier-protein] synthase II
MPDAPKVVVTGIGLTTALVEDPDTRRWSSREATWAALRSGLGGVRRLDFVEAAGPPYLGAAVMGEPDPGLDPVETLLRLASHEAAQDAGLLHGDFDPGRAASLIGLSKGYVRNLARAAGLVESGALDDPALGPSFVEGWPSQGAHRVASMWDLRGPGACPVAACATGLVAVLQGVQLLRRGVCDVAFAGAADASLDPTLLAAFRRMRVLAEAGPGEDPASAVRPCDRRRSGFAVGEGAAVLILERAEHAEARGVPAYAEVAGGALGSDAHHLTDLNPDPANLAGLIGRALARSGVAAEEIDHVNLHGTATRTNDPLECAAIRRALGPRSGRVAASANKAQIGHLLGAAGAAELAITCLALRDGFVPPTLNLRDPDPACDLDLSPVGRPREVRAALKLSLGFGGHLAAAVLRRGDRVPAVPTSRLGPAPGGR